MSFGYREATVSPQSQKHDPSGANWRIWDLHVHTPASIIQHYGDGTDETWNKYLSDLEALPEDFKVLGINDYIFLDGYKRILAERQNGRLANLDLVLPVVELRLDKFGGTDSSLSRVNFHVLFSEELDAEVIEQQFIQALSRAYKLSPGLSSLEGEWKGVATRKALEDLGRKIIASVPETERCNFGSPLVEGFNGLNFHLDDVLDVLNSPYFRGKHLTAVGKTEWWNIKWNDKSIADKKNVINSANLVFISSDTVQDYDKAKQSLDGAGVNSRLLDCSDAHSYSNSTHKDRIGNCLTWIKADTTFRGLELAAIEPDERFFVGDIPPQVLSVRQNKTKYFDCVTIKRNLPRATAFRERWFDAEIPVNSGLVAIIGNKGSGKSALADAVGLLGNAQSKASFSFLNNERFCRPPENKARFFDGCLFWKDASKDSARLDSEVSALKVEKLRYVPQDYFETICTQLPSAQESQFDKELKSVIFSHIPDRDKLRKSSLEDLLRHKVNEIDSALSKTVDQIENTNLDIWTIESHLTHEYAISLSAKLDEKKAELAAFDKEKPGKFVKSASVKAKVTPSIKRLESSMRTFENRKISAEERQAEITEDLDTIHQVKEKIDDFRSDFVELTEELQGLLEPFKLTAEDLIEIKVDENPIVRIEKELISEKRQLGRKLDAKNPNGLDMKLKNMETQLKGLRERLDAPGRAYEEHKRKLEEWTKKRTELVGTKRKTGSYANLSAQIDELKSFPGRLEQMYSKRRRLCKQAYACLQKQKAVYQELYAPIQEFVAEHPDISDRIRLKFGVSIVESGFVETFLEMINLSKTGAFAGSVEAKKAVRDILDRHDLSTEDGAVAFAEEIVAKLTGKDSTSAEGRSVAEQLKKGKAPNDVYSFLFSFRYLQPRYVLRLGSKDLQQLSPGERGALLIIFYLLIDKDTKPLVIDQPETNLDNETVTKLLVPAIKKAKQKRQIVMVTHNPILAVVCNADQVIVASMDKTAENRVEYESGAIENPVINKRIVDILEGTLPAFDNRNLKYIRDLYPDRIGEVERS